jgi:hypothetical protein
MSQLGFIYRTYQAHTAFWPTGNEKQVIFPLCRWRFPGQIWPVGVGSASRPGPPGVNWWWLNGGVLTVVA